MEKKQNKLDVGDLPEFWHVGQWWFAQKDNATFKEINDEAMLTSCPSVSEPMTK